MPPLAIFRPRDTEQIETLVANHMRFKDVFAMRPATLKRFVRLPRFEEHLELHRLDCLASHGKLDAYEFVQRFLRETPPEQVRPPRLITGDDLMQMGFRPGPLFKQILQAVEEAQLDGRLHGRDEAIEFVPGRIQDMSMGHERPRDAIRREPRRSADRRARACAPPRGRLSWFRLAKEEPHEKNATRHCDSCSRRVAACERARGHQGTRPPGELRHGAARNHERAG